MTRGSAAGTATASSPMPSSGNASNEPISGPVGLNSNEGRDAFLEELDALFSQRLNEFMGYDQDYQYDPALATGEEIDYDEIIPAAQPQQTQNTKQDVSFDVDEAISQANKDPGVASGSGTENENKEILPLVEQYFDDLQVVARKGHAVPDNIAKIVNYAFRNKMAEPVREAKLKHFDIPSNCEGLDHVKVNQVIWNKMHPSTRGMDVKMQTAQNFVVAAGSGLSNIISRVMAMKATDFNEATVKQLTTDMLTTQVLIGQANVELNHRRRELIKPDLSSSYSYLCTSAKPFSNFLFGDELNDSVKEISEANKVCEQIFPRGGSSGRSIRSRGSRGRGVRFQPYPPQYPQAGPSYSSYMGYDYAQYPSYGRGQQYAAQQRYPQRRPFLGKGRPNQTKRGRKENQ